jgi:NCAIR mutase (PurE)-related protein
VSFSFDPRSREFHLFYVPAPGIDAPTVIAVPTSIVYPHGYQVTVEGGVVRSAPGADRVAVTNQDGAATVAVTITAVG